MLEVGVLRIDMFAREVRCDGRLLKLTRRQFDLLAFLGRRPGRVFTRDQLLHHVWGFDFEGHVRAVRTARAGTRLETQKRIADPLCRTRISMSPALPGTFATMSTSGRKRISL